MTLRLRILWQSSDFMMLKQRNISEPSPCLTVAPVLCILDFLLGCFDANKRNKHEDTKAFVTASSLCDRCACFWLMTVTGDEDYFCHSADYNISNKSQMFDDDHRYSKMEVNAGRGVRAPS